MLKIQKVKIKKGQTNMKKAIVGAGALLAASILPVANAFAIDPLDYAKSVGSIGGADTINWVVEATSDGGYVVGGQTVGCYKYEGGGVRAAAIMDYGGELVELSECEEYFAEMPVDEKVSLVAEAKDADLPSIMDICGNNQLEEALSASAASDDDDGNYWYDISCIDYIAKFKKDGTKEWLTLVNDSSRPAAVAETKNDYRMLVENSTLYTFTKTGDEGLSTNLQYEPYADNSIINNDGSVVVGDYGDVCYYGANASLVRCAGQDEDENVSYYPAGYDGSMIRSDDGIILVRVIDDGEEGTLGLVRATRDLKTITPITNVNTDGFDGVLFGNKDGDFAVVNCMTQADDVAYSKMSALAGEVSQVTCKIVSYDKNGNKIAEKDINDLGIDSVGKIMTKDFVIIESDGTLVRFARNLDIILKHTLSENETLNDVAPLNDGSVVGVGVSTGTTDNYEVDTNANGVYLRLGAPAEQPAAPSTPDNVKNPGTLDAIQIFAGLGGVILLAGAIAGRKLITRR